MAASRRAGQRRRESMTPDAAREQGAAVWRRDGLADCCRRAAYELPRLGVAVADDKNPDIQQGKSIRLQADLCGIAGSASCDLLREVGALRCVIRRT
jgi:hypothetical protein